MGVYELLQIAALLLVIVSVVIGLFGSMLGDLMSGEGRSGGKGPVYRTTCPHCDAQVKIADKQWVGLWKDCPECKKRFQVESIQEGPISAKPKKASQTKPGATKHQEVPRPSPLISMVMTAVLALAAAALGLCALIRTGIEPLVIFLIPSVLIVFALANYSWARNAVLYIPRMLFYITIGALTGGGGDAAWSTAVNLETDHQSRQQRGKQAATPPHLDIPQAVSLSIMLAAIVCLLKPADRAAQKVAAHDAPGAAPAAASPAPDDIQRKPMQAQVPLDPAAQRAQDESILRAVLESGEFKNQQQLPEIRKLALSMLEPLPPLPEAAHSASQAPSLRVQLLPYLPQLGFSLEESRQHARRLLEDGDVRVRAAAARALATFAKEAKEADEDVAALLKQCVKAGPELQDACHQALLILAPRAQPQLLAALKSDHPDKRKEAAALVSILGTKQTFDISAALEYLDDEQVMPAAYDAAIRLAPFPKTAFPLVISRFRIAPPPSRSANALLAKFSPDDLKPFVDDLAGLADADDNSVASFGLEGLAAAGGYGLAPLAQRVRNARPGRYAPCAVAYQHACELVAVNDEKAIAFLTTVLPDDGDDNASRGLAAGAHKVLLRLGQKNPSGINLAELVNAFAGKSDTSAGAKRVQTVLQSIGEPSDESLLQGVASSDESICTWSLLTLKEMMSFRKSQPVYEAAPQIAKLALGSDSERVTRAAMQLLDRVPDDQLPKGVLTIVKPWLNSKDPAKKLWAESLTSRVKSSESQPKRAKAPGAK